LDKKPFVLKICLVTVTLSGGGAERVAADLSLYFESQGIEVYHVVFSGKIEYNYGGKILHLEHLKDKRNSWWSRSKRFFALKKFFKNNHFDYVIDFRTKEFFLQELIIHNFVYPKFIQTVHNYHLEHYFNKSKFLSKLMYINCLEFISVSKAINEKIISDYEFHNSILIYNPLNVSQIEIDAKEFLNFEFEFIVAAGRMHKNNVKQFDVIIETYSKSILPSKNIKLVILGDGELKADLINLAKKLNLEEHIKFEGFVSNPFKYFKKALFLIMASKFEGFPMVIVESLYCNLPVVTWDFNSGPSEIIETGKNGILVKNNDKTELIEAMNLLVSDNNLYLQCKENALSSVKQFSLETIGAEWLKVFEKKIT
jgi:glycosyltransferase involved in cell wall biosynthesis